MRSRILMIGLLLAGASGVARAQTPSCTDAAVGTNKVWIQAADTQVPVLRALGAKLKAQATPITIIYTPNGSCSNLPIIYNNTDFTSNAAGGGTFYIPDGYDGTSTPPTCIAPAVGSGQKADLGISIVFADKTDCPSLPAKPSTVAVTQGPVQAMVFAVPGGVGTNTGSTQTTITAEEAYLVAGLGPTKAMVAPWSDPTYFYGRPATKGTQVSIGANIGVAAAKWQLIADPNHAIDQSGNVLASIANQTTTGNAEKTIGILGVEIYDGARSMVHVARLPRLQAAASPTGPIRRRARSTSRTCATATTLLWSYVQYAAPQSAQPAARPIRTRRTIIDLLSGKTVATSPAFEPLDHVIANGLVPACAMKVQRSVEGGDMTPATIAEPCGCYFEFKTHRRDDAAPPAPTARPAAPACAATATARPSDDHDDEEGFRPRRRARAGDAGCVRRQQQQQRYARHGDAAGRRQRHDDDGELRHESDDAGRDLERVQQRADGRSGQGRAVFPVAGAQRQPSAPSVNARPTDEDDRDFCVRRGLRGLRRRHHLRRQQRPVDDGGRRHDGARHGGAAHGRRAAHLSA